MKKGLGSDSIAYVLSDMQPQQPVPYLQHFPSCKWPVNKLVHVCVTIYAICIFLSASQYTDEGPDGYESDTTSEVSGDSNDEGSDDYSDEEPSPVPLRQQPRPQMVYGAPGMQQSPPASTCK